MRKRLLIRLAVLLVAITGLIAWQVRGHREPVYEGKTLGTWLEGYMPNPKDYRPAVEQPQWQQADAAVRGLGTNAIPTLLRMLRAKDSTFKLTLARLASKQRLFKIRYTSASELNMRASMAFGSLKEKALESVPALIQIFQENHSEYSQNAVVNALRSIGPTAEMAVPCLVSAAASTNFSIRNNALAALGEIHAYPELAVPVLTNALNDPDPTVRGAAACGLRDFGADAKTAVPALLSLLKDENSYASGLAAEALQQIDPEAAARAGVK